MYVPVEGTITSSMKHEKKKVILKNTPKIVFNFCKKMLSYHPRT